MDSNNDQIRISDYAILDTANFCLLVGDDRKHRQLTPTEYRLLSCLYSLRGRAVTHKVIHDKVWPEMTTQQSSMICKCYVNYLRGYLERDPKKPKYLVTIHGFGYTLRVWDCTADRK